MSSNKTKAGLGEIEVMYHNGSSVVSGYSVRQMGPSRYEVTSDGNSKFIVSLVKTTADALDLLEGQATIKAVNGDGETVFITKLEMNLASTTSGVSVNWRNAKAHNAVTIARIGEAVVKAKEPEVVKPLEVIAPVKVKHAPVEAVVEPVVEAKPVAVAELVAVVAPLIEPVVEAPAVPAPVVELTKAGK